MSNPLAPLLRDDQIVLDADVKDRQQLLRTAADLLAPRHGLHGQDVFKALQERESLGSTALGYGVAIPHARMRVAEPVAAYIRTRYPIPFGAPDGKPVSHFLVLLVPNQANEHHLRLMAAAAEAFSDPDVRSTLATCESCAQVREAVAPGEEPAR